MISIDFYRQFAKKTNSTRRPDDNPLAIPYTIQGLLKDPCTVMEPVLTFERFPADLVPVNYNYAFISIFNRYYFVEDWTWENNFWVCRMKVDVLASFRPSIGLQEEYILRTNDDTGANFNGAITDTVYPATTDFETSITFAPNVFTDDLSVGCYIVGIISGGSSDAVGAISYFAFTSAEFGALKAYLFSDDNLMTMEIYNPQTGTELVPDVSHEVLKTLFNPFQYIASCMWFPFPKSAIQDINPVSSINIGWWDYAISASQVLQQNIEFGEALPLNAHPQSATRGIYLNYAPFTRRTLIGRFGTVALDSSFYKEDDNVGIGYFIDLITGQCRTRIERKYYVEQNLHNDPIAERQFLIGVPIQIAQVGTDYLGTAASAIGSVTGAVGNLVSGNISEAISGAASGIYNTIRSAMPQVETTGSNGSFIAPATQTELIEQYFTIVDEDITHKGRPLCEIRQLNTLSGFVLCAEGDLDIPCFDNERKEIKQFLTTGFFWE